MKIRYGTGILEYGPGISIDLTGVEVVTAIETYLTAYRVYINGPRTITINGALCDKGNIYVDPSGFVTARDRKISGRGWSK